MAVDDRNEDDRFYKAELDYLDKAGQEYARLHPQRAQHLGITEVRSRDPHVERLVQAFAFLSGRVHRRLDDDFPELTHSLLDLVWTHYLKPVPSLALLQFQPSPGMQKPETFERGYEVKSRSTSLDTYCQFRTLYPVEVYPITLDDAQMVTPEDTGQPQLRFRFRRVQGADTSKLQLDRIRLHLMGEPAVTYCAYRLLRQRVKCLRLRFGRDRERRFWDDDATRRIQAVGFHEDESVLPDSPTSFPGYRLLAEYFAFREKFLFLDLCDLGGLELEGNEETFDLFVVFDDRPPDSFRPNTENFQLYVTPILNLFQRNGEPIKVDHLRRQHQVLGNFNHPEAYEVYSVDHVLASRQREAPRRIHPFFSFEHDRQEEDDDSIYYQVTQDFSPVGRWQTRLALISSAKSANLPETETLSLELTCTNGRLCNELAIGDIRKPLGNASYRNISRPTTPIYPRFGGGSEWSFISHMALNMLSLGDAAALRRILELYDFERRPENRRRIEALTRASTRSIERLIGGALVRGTEIVIEIDHTRFDEEGEILLLGEVLNEFLALYASTNAFTRLIVRQASPEREDLEWKPAIGRQSLI